MSTRTAMAKRSFGAEGIYNKIGVKVIGLTGHATGGCLVDTFENPYGEDVLIIEAYAAITTLSATDGDIDIGLADDEAGTNKGAEIVDSMVHSAVAIHTYLLHTPAVTGVSYPIWKAANAAHTAVDSWIACWQNTSADSSAVRYNLILVCVREADFNSL